MTRSVASPVPALDKVSTDQRGLFADLQRGFGDRRDIVLWCHQCSVRTLGMVPDEWFLSVLSNRYAVAALLDDDQERETAAKHPPMGEAVELERDLLGDDALLTACAKSLQFLDDRAGDYGDSDKPVQANVQKFLAMRPALDDLATRQRDVLTRVLGREDNPETGLRDRSDLREWARDLVRATKGANGGGLSRDALWRPAWRMDLLGDPTAPSLHVRLANDVLSQMNRTIRQTAYAATEAAHRETTNHGTFDT